MKMRVAALAAFSLIVISPAFAGPREEALDAVSKCANVADDHARLACYDAAAAQVKAALATPEPQVAAQPQSSESWFGLPDVFGHNDHGPQTTPQQFGNDYLPPPPPAPGQPAPPAPPPEIDSITAGVSDYAFHVDGRFTVFLDNGQIWQQIQGDTDKATFRKNGPNKVTISRGAFGSYGLQINDLSRSYKVKRIK